MYSGFPLYLQYNNKHYNLNHFHGTAMGSLVSLVVAEVVYAKHRGSSPNNVTYSRHEALRDLYFHWPSRNTPVIAFRDSGIVSVIHLLFH